MLLRCFFQHVRFYRFKCRGIVRKALRAEMRFEVIEELVAIGLRRGFESDAFLVVGSAGGARAEVRAADAAKARQDFPCELIDHFR
jgi:hypothetical protein